MEPTSWFLANIKNSVVGAQPQDNEDDDDDACETPLIINARQSQYTNLRKAEGAATISNGMVPTRLLLSRFTYSDNCTHKTHTQKLSQHFFLVYKKTHTQTYPTRRADPVGTESPPPSCSDPKTRVVGCSCFLVWLECHPTESCPPNQKYLKRARAKMCVCV